MGGFKQGWESGLDLVSKVNVNSGTGIGLSGDHS